MNFGYDVRGSLIGIGEMGYMFFLKGGSFLLLCYFLQVSKTDNHSRQTVSPCTSITLKIQEKEKKVLLMCVMEEKKADNKKHKGYILDDKIRTFVMIISMFIVISFYHNKIKKDCK